MRLYVGNLPYSTTEDELRGMFAEFGEIASLRIVTDADSGRSKGFGFVELADDEQAKAAMSSLNGRDMQGRAIVVNEARPRPERTGGGGGGGRRGGGGGGYGGGRGGYGGGRDRY